MSKVTGKVKVLFDPITFDSGFTKREVVVTTQEQYPQDVKLEFVKDRISLLDKLNVGDSVEISYNLRGNEYNGKYFVNLEGWKIDVSSTTKSSAPEPQLATPQNSKGIGADLEDSDELPF